MRSRVAGLAVLIALCLPATASAAPGAPGTPALGNTPHAFKRACGKPNVRHAACHAILATEPSGAPLALAGPTGYGPASLPQRLSAGHHAGRGQDGGDRRRLRQSQRRGDLATYRSTFGLPPCTTANGCFKKVNQIGGTSPPAADVGWGQEISLDVDMVSAMCRTARSCSSRRRATRSRTSPWRRTTPPRTPM